MLEARFYFSPEIVVAEVSDSGFLEIDWVTSPRIVYPRRSGLGPGDPVYSCPSLSQYGEGINLLESLKNETGMDLPLSDSNFCHRPPISHSVKTIELRQHTGTNCDYAIYLYFVRTMKPLPVGRAVHPASIDTHDLYNVTPHPTPQALQHAAPH